MSNTRSLRQQVRHQQRAGQSWRGLVSSPPSAESFLAIITLPNLLPITIRSVEMAAISSSLSYTNIGSGKWLMRRQNSRKLGTSDCELGATGIPIHVRNAARVKGLIAICAPVVAIASEPVSSALAYSSDLDLTRDCPLMCLKERIQRTTKEVRRISGNRPFPLLNQHQHHALTPPGWQARL